jgi:O-antigen ligase
MTALLSSRRFIVAFTATTFFVALAGDAVRYSISWYGFGVVALAITILSALIVAHNAPLGLVKQLPIPLAVFLLLAAASTAWSYYAGATALGVIVLLATTMAGLAIAVSMNWEDVVHSLGIALRWVLVASLVFELVVSVFIRRPILPLWSLGVDYDSFEKIPKLFYWSRNLLFEGGKIQGIVGNSSLLVFVALLGVIVFGIQWAAGTVKRLPALASMTVAIACVLLTRSATITLALAVLGAIVVAALSLRRAQTPRARVAVYSWIGLAFAMAAAGTFFARSAILGLLGKSADLTGRFDIWQAVIDLAIQRPVFGWGWIGYWAPWVAPFDTLVTKAGVRQLHAHNAWLDVWLQLGVVGVIVFGALLAMAFGRSWSMATRIYATGEPATRQPAAITLLPLLIVCALLVQSIAESRILVEYGWLLVILLSTKLKMGDRPALP